MQAFYQTADVLFPEVVSQEPKAAGAQVVAFSEEHPWQNLVPKMEEGYFYSLALFRELHTFIERADPNVFLAAKLSGFPGTSKTSGVLQYFARTNRPILSLNGTPSTEAEQLIGKNTLRGGEIVWTDGVLAMAMRFGLPLLINEWNVIPEEQRVGLNEVLDGRPLMIADTGEVLPPQPGFRIFLTENPYIPGMFGSRAPDDPSTNERSYKISCSYPPKEVEVEIVASKLQPLVTSTGADPSFIRETADKMVTVAEKVRAMYMGSSIDAKALEITMSTRTISRWACAFVMWAGHEKGIHKALARTLTEGIKSTAGRAIHEMVASEFGETFGEGDE